MNLTARIADQYRKCGMAPPKELATKAPKKRGMNGLEKAYAQFLELRVQAGLVAWFAFESVKLRLADRTWYIPDFMVMLVNGEIEIHEAKGFMREDARVKLNVAAETFPFTFRLCRMCDGQWDIQVVPSGRIEATV